MQVPCGPHGPPSPSAREMHVCEQSAPVYPLSQLHACGRLACPPHLADCASAGLVVAAHTQLPWLEHELSVVSRQSGSSHAVPPHPVLHTHTRLVAPVEMHVPWLEHATPLYDGQASEVQSAPLHPEEHEQTGEPVVASSVHVPRSGWHTGEHACTVQPSPAQPATHTHAPSTHEPRDEPPHSRPLTIGQRAACVRPTATTEWRIAAADVSAPPTPRTSKAYVSRLGLAVVAKGAYVGIGAFDE